ncbi:MAG TPA: hypothetical protein VLG67_03165 [Candidatus Saccharimonadales bacterium]|nr:hypothetical protein [Candidatus Saccharimonadales bacterium]
MTKKKIISMLSVLVIFGSTAMPAFAATGSTNNGNWFSGFVTFISQKFNLDKNQVQSAANEFHTQKVEDRQKNMQDHEKTRLDNLVKQGKITSEQETAILAEIASLKAKYPMKPTDTKQQRMQNMQSMINDFNTWAKSQNIDPKLVMVGPFEHGRGRGGFGKWGPKTTPTHTP